MENSKENMHFLYQDLGVEKPIRPRSTDPTSSWNKVGYNVVVGMFYGKQTVFTTIQHHSSTSTIVACKILSRTVKKRVKNVKKSAVKL